MCVSHRIFTGGALVCVGLLLPARRDQLTDGSARLTASSGALRVRSPHATPVGLEVSVCLRRRSAGPRWRTVGRTGSFLEDPALLRPQPDRLLRALPRRVCRYLEVAVWYGGTVPFAVVACPSADRQRVSPWSEPGDSARGSAAQAGCRRSLPRAGDRGSLNRTGLGGYLRGWCVILLRPAHVCLPPHLHRRCFGACRAFVARTP